MSSIDDLRMQPSQIDLYGHDPAELKRYQKMMTPSRGNKKGHSETVFLLSREWHITDIIWKGDLSQLIYRVTLRSIVEISK